MRVDKPSGLLAVIGPGLLVAATGVGAGDLATASLAGSRLGLGVLWAVLLGGIFKFVLNEGLARWQLVTGETLIEGALGRLGRPAGVLFLAYLLPWSLFVGSALISACGVTAHAALPIFEDPRQGKIVFGVLHSGAGLLIARLGGFRVFERFMSGTIALMFVTVLVTAVLVQPDWSLAARGLLVPRIPDLAGDGLSWTVALIGGVGGTVTILCYGYWIREQGRLGPEEIRTCRIDLAVGYLMTALFGVAMVIIGSTVRVEGTGANLVVRLAERLELTLGAAGLWLFLLGAWAAVFTSLLGVWQAVPYIFADAWRLARQPGNREGRVAQSSRPYRLYQLGLACVPLLGLVVSFREVQKYYALVGAAFLPLLAVALLVLNGNGSWMGRYRNRPLTATALVGTLLFFFGLGLVEVRNQLGW